MSSTFNCVIPLVWRGKSRAYSIMKMPLVAIFSIVHAGPHRVCIQKPHRGSSGSSESVMQLRNGLIFRQKSPKWPVIGAACKYMAVSWLWSSGLLWKQWGLQITWYVQDFILQMTLFSIWFSCHLLGIYHVSSAELGSRDKGQTHRPWLQSADSLVRKGSISDGLELHVLRGAHVQGAWGAHRDGMAVSVCRKGCLVRDCLICGPDTTRHTLQGGQIESGAVVKTENLMETDADKSLVEIEAIRNSHSVCDHIINSLECHASSHSLSHTQPTGASSSASPSVPMPPFHTPRRGEVIGFPGILCLL